MFVVAIFVTACKPHPALTECHQLRADIRVHLPIGSSKAKVDTYLDERKIRHSCSIAETNSLAIHRLEHFLFR